MPTDTPVHPVAAVDLGSNSFHLLVARIQDGHLSVIDRLKEPVQLAAGLDHSNCLDEAARRRALSCLSRFGQRLRGIPANCIRAVGTNTLRRAKNSGELLAAAEAALGHPIEVISGIEEGRLIYLGAAHTMPGSNRQRLVVDIGGGSTELILGEGFEPQVIESLHMGCINITQQAFGNSKFSIANFARADLVVQRELAPILNRYRLQSEHGPSGWEAVGCSGSIKAVEQALREEGLAVEGITLEAMQRLRTRLTQQSVTFDELLERWSFDVSRAQVFGGGFAVLYGLCHTLNIQRVTISNGALREGLIYDLMGRIRHDDARYRTVNALSRRYQIDGAHGMRVATTAKRLYSQVAEDWSLTQEEHLQLLTWGARLHEIGLTMAHTQYHKHGDYILRHSDLPGFSRTEQALLATLVRYHRRKIAPKEYKELGADLGTATLRLTLLLRLAVLLHRNRGHDKLPAIKLAVKSKRMELNFEDGWLANHPLTRADLEAEAEYLKAVGVALVIN